MPTQTPRAPLVATATLLIVAWSAIGEAQIGFPYPYRYVERDSSVRLQVTPKEAEVYVDGYYAGIVDDYDGMFQRLHVAPGEHEITLYRDGYRAVTQHVYLTPASTFKIKYKMEPLAAGEATPSRPVPPAPPPTAQSGPPPLPPRGPIGRRVPPPPNGPVPNAPPPQGQSTSGTLAIRVQPPDAEVLIDGEPWHAPAAQDRLVVDLGEGRHTVEIRKAGYVGYLTEVQIRRGETTPLNVSLRTQP